MTGRVFYTSDLHLGHENVATRHRGFESSGDHDNTFVDMWLDTVEAGDTVYVLGDVVGRTRDARYALALLGGLPGTKHLVAGNHDPVHPMHRSTFAKDMPAWLEVFATVAPFLRRKLVGRELLLSHFPYASWGEGPARGGAEAARYPQYRLPDLGTPLLHGHTHGAERTHGHSLHVGLDAWGGKLVPQETVIEWLSGVPAPA
ncbi:metallophosphoesterase [Microbacterium sp.]|uniref:metallophosphoesterase n=1 Tax=Microbacterium sp. TaxID=51671 RepID=UPI003242A300